MRHTYKLKQESRHRDPDQIYEDKNKDHGTSENTYENRKEIIYHISESW